MTKIIDWKKAKTKESFDLWTMKQNIKRKDIERAKAREIKRTIINSIEV